MTQIKISAAYIPNTTVIIQFHTLLYIPVAPLLAYDVLDVAVVGEGHVAMLETLQLQGPVAPGQPETIPLLPPPADPSGRSVGPIRQADQSGRSVRLIR